MALQGNIHDFGLVDIVQLISLQKKTGLLEIQKGKDTAMIFFDHGQILYASSSKKGDTEKIGQILLKTGKITAEQLQDALERQSEEGGTKGGQRIGQMLESLGYVKRDDIQEALQFQVKEILFNLFRWHDGTYQFDAQPLTFDKEYHIPLPTEFLLMEALRMVDEWPYIEKKIPSYRVVFAKVLAAEDRVHPYLVPEEERVYIAVDGKKDVSDIIEELQTGEFETCKILANLLVSGLIQEASISQKQESISADSETRLSPWNRRLVRLLQWPILALGTTVLLWGGFPFSVLDGKEWSPFFKEIREAVTLQRIDRVDHTIKLYFLKNGRLPEDLNQLIREGWLAKRMIYDTDGRAFQLQKMDKGYLIIQSG